jgi:FtsH-binding integral membrane protein
MFGAAGAYAAATRRSLANRRGYVSMVLTGILIAWFVNLVVFTRPVDELWISILGVVAFVGLTAWNVRKTSRADDPRAAGATEKGSVAALAVYLEVINVFLDLARQADRIVGDTREDPAWNARHGIPADRPIRPR